MPTIRTPTAKTAPLNTAEAEAIIKRPAVAQATSYNVTAAHNREIHELADGITATLPTASGSLTETDDWFVTFKAMGASGATIDTNSQNVDGSASDITLAQYETVTIAMNAGTSAFHKVNEVLIIQPVARGGTAASTAGSALANLKLHVFTVQNNGVGVSLPAGWSSSRGIPGYYTITHNLGHTDYSVLVSPDTVGGAGTSVVGAGVDTRTTTSFNVWTQTLATGTNQDTRFSVLVRDLT